MTDIVMLNQSDLDWMFDLVAEKISEVRKNQELFVARKEYFEKDEKELLSLYSKIEEMYNMEASDDS